MLARQRQFGIKKEATEGTAETLAAADFALNTKSIDPPGPAIPAYERELMRGSLSKDPVLKAVRSLTLKATVELTGGTASATSPWHDAVEACGFVKTQLKIMDAGAQSGGTFTPGDLVGNNATYASATKTAILIKYITGGKMVLLPLTGTFVNTDTVYNYASPQVSSVIGSALSNAGWGFRLRSETASAAPVSATIECRDGEQIHRIIGGRGMVEFTIQHNAPTLMAFEFKGPLATSSDVLPTGGFVSSVPANAAAPVMGKNFPITFDTFSPVLTNLGIKIDNTLALRPNMGTTQVSESGYMATRITDRKISVSSDPEHPVVATQSWFNKALAGTSERLYVQVGQLTPGAAAGTVIFGGPKLVISDDPSMGDRDGIVIDNLTMQMAWNGTDDDEFWFAHVFN